MAVSSVTTNYSTRKRDISILQYPVATLPDAQTVTPKFGKNARFCAGVQKLVQRYAIILLTNLNSQEKYPDFGTDFLYSVQSGINPTDTGAASQLFSLASYSAVKLIKSDQISRRNVPLDEQLNSATLTNISMLGDNVVFDVSIQTMAGTDVQFVIPLPK